MNERREAINDIVPQTVRDRPSLTEEDLAKVGSLISTEILTGITPELMSPPRLAFRHWELQFPALCSSTPTFLGG